MQADERVTDLAAWLTAVWDEEADEPAPHHLGCNSVADGDRGGLLPCDCGYPMQMLARIAADRKILALHSYHVTPSLDSHFKRIPGTERPHCDTCASQDENGEWWPCETVRLLASPYADRPGFRSEWLVERQGVEQG